MEYRVYDFYKNDKEVRRKCIGNFFKEQWFDILMSYGFILLSSGLPFISLTNGAVWVLVWYTVTLLISLCIFISQYEYNLAKKLADRVAKKHPRYNVEKGYIFSAEIGGWNFIAAQYICLPILFFILGSFSIVTQFNNLPYYMKNYKDFCLSIFADTYVLLFVNVYYKVVILQVKSINGWKNKVKYFLHTFKKSVTANVIIHISAQIIMVSALYFYFTREFSGLFNPVIRRIIGLVYIITIMIDVKSVIRKIYLKLK